MPIPTQTDMFSFVLELMSDGKARSQQEIRDAVRNALDLTPEECKDKTSSGRPVYESRAGWSVSYLTRAKLINRVKRGVYKINDDGKALLETGLRGSEFANELNRLIAERNPWNIGSESEKKRKEQKSKRRIKSDMSPEEQIDVLVEDINESLSNELLDSILKNSPEDFERLVVDLLERMGYGDGQTTQYVGDGGIDGIITTDALGFDPIHIQAKCYKPGNKIGSPDIQKFAGALRAVTRGVFITTSSFTDEARKYADEYPHATILLIDGEKLTELMIKHDLGVNTDRVYRVKRIDSDYFEG